MEKKKVHISFGALPDVEDKNEVDDIGTLSETQAEESAVKELESNVTNSQETFNEVKVNEEEDTGEEAYAVAVDRLFEQYQAFQEGMQALMKMMNQPALMKLKLNALIKSFKEEIQHFRNTDFVVGEAFLEGHQHIEDALEKYDVFLVEYPKVLDGKGGFKSMKKVKNLGALSGRADQDMKAAFRSFAEAVGVETDGDEA